MTADRVVILFCCLLALTGCATGTATERVMKYCRPYPPAESNVKITLASGATYNVPNYGPTFVRNLEEQRCFEAAVEASEELPAGVDPCVVRWCPTGPRGTK